MPLFKPYNQFSFWMYVELSLRFRLKLRLFALYLNREFDKTNDFLNSGINKNGSQGWEPQLILTRRRLYEYDKDAHNKSSGLCQPG